MILLLTIPHSGTRWMHGILGKCGFDILHNTLGRHGMVLHWHYAPHKLPNEQDWDLPKVGLLRDPLATIISHWRSVEDSAVPRETLWPQRLDEMTRGWQEMAKHRGDTYFFPVEFANHGHWMALQHILAKATGFDNTEISNPSTYIGMDKYANQYPLKDAYLGRDLETIANTIPDGLKLAHTALELVGDIYEERGYAPFWWHIGEHCI